MRLAGMSRARLSQSWGGDPWERPDLHQPQAVLGPAEKYSSSPTHRLLSAGRAAGTILLSSLELPPRGLFPQAAGASPVLVPKLQILGGGERSWGSSTMLSCCIYHLFC